MRLPSIQRLISELKRRKVFRVAAVYAVAAWPVVQVADAFFPALQLPGWTVTFVAALAILGFPLAVILAWAFEMTPDGVRRSAPAGDVAGTSDGAGATGRMAWAAALLLTAVVAVGATWLLRGDTRDLRARLAADAGRTAEAAEAYRAYLALRSGPETPVEAAAAEARRALARLAEEGP